MKTHATLFVLAATLLLKKRPVVVVVVFFPSSTSIRSRQDSTAPKLPIRFYRYFTASHARLALIDMNTFMLAKLTANMIC